MKFKELSEEQNEYLKYVYYEDMKHKEKMEILTKKFDVIGRTIRRWWKEELNLSEHPSSLPSQIKVAQQRELKKKTNIVFVTSAQNKTGVNNKFLDNLIAYANHLEILGNRVEIVIAPTRYRNPTSPTETKGQKTEQWWVDEVIPYLHYGKLQFGDVLISTDSRIRPTAKEPLLGYEVLAKDNSLILPHSKVHFKTLPRFRNDPLRVMATTGKIFSKEHKLKISASKKGIKKSKKFKESRRKNSLGNKNNFYNKKHSKESKELMSDNRKGLLINNENGRAIKVINTKTKKIFDCIKCAAEYLGIKEQTFRAMLKGYQKNKTDFIYLSEYVGDDNKISDIM